MSCWDDEAGAFGTHPGHDAHILSTLSAIQILATHDALARNDVPRVVDSILDLQQSSGVFAGDVFGETDTRFLYCAVSALTLLGTLDHLDRERTVSYLASCRNPDDRFGLVAGDESHAAQPRARTAALAILDRLDVINVPTLGWWFAERQLPKASRWVYWVLSSLAVLDKLKWIDITVLPRFILFAQDPEGGTGQVDMMDVFRTLFGVAGLSLFGYPGLDHVDPVYCMPASLIERMGLKNSWKALPRREA
ncbi:terpenoid cyclases/protein prenyltransferase alpha-alpha toroid [Lactifluus subvellereus]|nr:terpenoid cyclases/protein prenyltransferase alpha-alpha toroid [Lactifluus subvellereus]